MQDCPMPITSVRRNIAAPSQYRDALIDWMRDMLKHTFVLNCPKTYFDSMEYFEAIFNEHYRNPQHSRLREMVPSIGPFHTPLLINQAFKFYDTKYSVSSRRHIPPSFDEIRHTLNIAQIAAIGKDISMITFDGDQTLYDDGGNFGQYPDIAEGICKLLKENVYVCVVTAAGYGLDGSKYEVRLRSLLDDFVRLHVSEKCAEKFYVCGGECNYLLQCKYVNEEGNIVARLVPVPYEDWQNESLGGPRPYFWPREEVSRLLDVAENEIRSSIKELRLRAKVIRKERALGMISGGVEMKAVYPQGHGSKKMKREALDEVALRVKEALNQLDPPIQIPYCAFNGGSDVWVDIGNKNIGVMALQAFFGIPSSKCLHVGDQFSITGNDIAARQSSPCIWVISPKETGRILFHVQMHKVGEANQDAEV